MKKTTKIIWTVMAIIAFSFNLCATDIQERQDFKQGMSCYEKEEYEKAFQFFKTDADKGDAEAQFWVGRCYHNGEGVAQDYALAAEWYIKSVDQDYFKAQYNLALLYYYENGVKQDYKKAFQLFMAAANQGFELAQFSLGLCYDLGQGTTKNHTLAAEWYTKSADQGNSSAQYNLALLYYNGEGVEKDYEKAFELAEKAVIAGDRRMQRTFGVMYYRGRGVEKDYAKAKEWLSKAVEQGDKDAQEFLKLINGKEQPVPKSIAWTIHQDGDSYTEYRYSVGNVRVKAIYWKGTKKISSISINGVTGFYLSKADDEIKGRFNTMKELSEFLLRCHNDFFYSIDDDELVDVIRKHSAPRETVTFD